MLTLQSIAFRLLSGEVLFENLHFSLAPHEKVALTGNNGAGKSTLLRIMAGLQLPAAGTVQYTAPPYYVPQHFGQYGALSIASALRIEHKLAALRAILSGDVSAENLDLLEEDWGLEERCGEALAHWGLPRLSLDDPLSRLSGGEKTKVFLAGIAVHQPGLVLLDEPSNHLDTAGRHLLYDYVSGTRDSLIVVSHDRALLGLMNKVAELDRGQLQLYGGDFHFYTAQKALQQQALYGELRESEKALRKARNVERESAERQQKLDARGRRKQEKSGLPTISMNTLRNQAEKSTAHSKDVHAAKTGALTAELNRLRQALPDREKMRIGFSDASLHSGKVLFRAEALQYSTGGMPLWREPLSFEIRSGERMVIRGHNGSGKTTLLRLLRGDLHPTGGSLACAAGKIIYIDQEYSLIDEGRSVYEQAQHWNKAPLEEHEVRRILDHFLFGKEDLDKPCAVLSGGERLRLTLCCLTLDPEPPVLLLLDEPTNNLDLQNTAILTEAVRDYAGTLIVVSHDEWFVEELGVERALRLE